LFRPQVLPHHASYLTANGWARNVGLSVTDAAGNTSTDTRRLTLAPEPSAAAMLLIVIVPALRRHRRRETPTGGLP
jgi:hypothetical protein